MQETDQSPALSVTLPRYGLITKGSADVWTWVKRALDEGADVVAEPFLSGERQRITVDGPPSATLDTVLHVSEDLGSVAHVFDIVTYGATDLGKTPLRERRRFMTRALIGSPGLKFVPWRPVTSRASLVRAISRIKGDGAPGVMFKRTDSVVKAGASEDWAVIKFDKVSKADMVKVAIRKKQHAQQIAIGVVMEPDVADTHEEGTQREEIETAANQFLEDYRRGRTILRMQHKMDMGDDDVVLTQHYIAPVDFMIEDEMVFAGSWVQAWKFNDPSVWARVESGEFTGFSIGGYARKVPA